MLPSKSWTTCLMQLTRFVCALPAFVVFLVRDSTLCFFLSCVVTPQDATLIMQLIRDNLALWNNPGKE